MLDKNVEKYLNIIKNNPHKIGKLIGFDKLTPFHNEWINKMIFNKSDTTLQGHRGSYKTTCLSIAIPLLMVLQPNKNILFLRKTDTDVKEIVNQIYKVLINRDFRYIAQQIQGIPLEITTRNATQITTNLMTSSKGTEQLNAFGIGSSITGKHYDYIFTDDIVNISDRSSKAERDRTKNTYYELFNVINRGGRIFNLGTPWHKDDCFSIMPPADKYDCYSTGLMSPEEIEKLKKDMPPSLFAANYELRHIASEDVIFKDPQYSSDLSLIEQGVCHIDCAYGGEDYTAFTIMRELNSKFYVFGKVWQKKITDVKNQILALYQKYMCGQCFMEDNGDKGFAAEMLKNAGMRTFSYHEHENKYIKIVTFICQGWQNIVFMSDTDKEYMNQILEYNENAEHDDAPDSLASLLRCATQKRFSFD